MNDIPNVIGGSSDLAGRFLSLGSIVAAVLFILALAGLSVTATVAAVRAFRARAGQA